MFNLAQIDLTPGQKHLLTLGLKHIPRYRYNKDTILTKTATALSKLSRNLKLRLKFQHEPQTPLPLFPRKPSTYTPGSDTPGIDIVNKWHEEITAKLFNYSTPVNNTISKYDAYILHDLKSLKQLPVVIKPADKNLGTALLSPALYHDLCMQHLNDTTTYKKLDSDTNMSRITKEVFQALEAILDSHGALYKPPHRQRRRRTEERLKSELAASLLQLNPAAANQIAADQPAPHQNNLRMSTFYVLPKLHKRTISGRPIVNTINSYTYMTSIYLHRVLFQALPHLPTVVSSTHAALRRLLQLQLPPDAILLCADVKSLYPSIPINYGMHAVQRVLVQLQEQRLIRINIPLTIQLLEWTLSNNYISYLDEVYLQLTGTAMGTPVAVMYANITLAFLESTAAAYQPYLYMRYIDDLCIICNNNEQANNIVLTFNAQCPSIILEEVTISNRGVFLDLSIELCSNAYRTEIKLQTYQKSINKYMYITPKSNHQLTILKNFIYNELCRYRLQCSNDREFRNMVRLFNERIRKRDYNKQYISHIFNTIPSRSVLIQRLFTVKAKEKFNITVCTLPKEIQSFIPKPKQFLAMNTTMILHPITSTICSTNKLKFNYANDPNLLHHLCNDARTKAVVKNGLASPPGNIII